MEWMAQGKPPAKSPIVPVVYGVAPYQLLVESVESLRLLGKRSMLALLGIMISTASIVSLLNIGGNAADEATRAFSHLGSESLVVNLARRPETQHPLPSNFDAEALKQALPAVSYVAPLTLAPSRVALGGKIVDATLIGSTADLAPALGVRVREGRFLSPFEHRETLAVIGARVAHDLSSPNHPVKAGTLLRLDNYQFQIIGIAESVPANSLMPMALDDSIVLPIESLRRLQPAPEIGCIVVRTSAQVDLPQVAQQLDHYLVQLLPQSSVSVRVPQEVLDGLRRQASTFSYLLAGMGAISLLVGGVGVMNVMFISVTERRREIGIRIALGARRRDIRNMFLLEAATLAIAGTLIGGLLGFAIAFFFAVVSGWHFTPSLGALLLGCGSSLIVGIFFGVYPALTAARLTPVRALRDA